MMHRLVFDFENYFDSTYTLKKIPTILYIRDPRFKIHGCGIKIDSDPAFWVPGCDLEDFFSELQWGEYRVVCHTPYDTLVLWEHFNISPGFRTDTAGLARATLGNLIPNAELDTISRILGFGEKGDELDLTKGIRDLPHHIESELAKYCINDVNLTAQIDDTLYPALPESEKLLLNLTMKWSSEAYLFVNHKLASEGHQQAKQRTEKAIDAVPYTATQLRSTKQFPEIIRSKGIEVPQKKVKNKLKNALAKDDFEFHQLQAEHPEHADLWAARLAATGQNDLQRLGRMVEIAETPAGSLALSTNYSGAHTHRWSGYGKINVQNFVRGSASRRSLTAPPGFVILVVDSSGIELGGNLWLADEHDLLAIHADPDQDLYAITATKYFGYEVTKLTFPAERSFGKLKDLALGYNMGSPKFRIQAAIGAMGTTPRILTPYDASVAVAMWREDHQGITGNWDFLDSMVEGISRKGFHFEWKCVTFSHETVTLPSGLTLNYPDLHYDEQSGNWKYRFRGGWSTLYGGKFLENINQANARDAFAEQLLETSTELHVLGSTHDEGLWLVRENEADAALAWVINIMSQSPSWAPEWPMLAEGGYDYCYSK